MLESLPLLGVWMCLQTSTVFFPFISSYPRDSVDGCSKRKNNAAHIKTHDQFSLEYSMVLQVWLASERETFVVSFSFSLCKPRREMVGDYEKKNCCKQGQVSVERETRENWLQTVDNLMSQLSLTPPGPWRWMAGKGISFQFSFNARTCWYFDVIMVSWQEWGCVFFSQGECQSSFVR